MVRSLAQVGLFREPGARADNRRDAGAGGLRVALARGTVAALTLEAWTRAGWLRTHETQAGEVAHLMAVAEVDLRAAADPAHAPSLRFEYAYNAALKYCLVALYAHGLRPGRVDAVHHTIIRSLPLTLGGDREAAADHLDACRTRRDRLEGEEAGRITDEDAAGLRDYAAGLRDEVHAWLLERHPEYVGG